MCAKETISRVGASDSNIARMQYEACKEALELLESTPDAQGRKLQVHKVYLPPNLFLSQEEASQMVVRPNFKRLHLNADLHRILQLIL